MKGLFTQGAALLLGYNRSRSTSCCPCSKVSASRRRLGASGNWALGGETLLLGFRQRAAARWRSTWSSSPWPDEMGDPQLSPELFGAWSNGYFGPFTFPQRLRARRPPGLDLEGSPGRPAGAPGLPPPAHQLRLRRGSPATRCDPGKPRSAGRAAGAHRGRPGAFPPPGGDRLFQPQRRNPAASANGWPKPSTGPRRRSVPRSTSGRTCASSPSTGCADGWFLMDTVGMLQLDVPDHEIFLPGKTYDFREAEGFLRNVALYVMNHGPVFDDGDTIDGPGGKNWVATSYRGILHRAAPAGDPLVRRQTANPASSSLSQPMPTDFGSTGTPRRAPFPSARAPGGEDLATDWHGTCNSRSLIPGSRIGSPSCTRN